MKKLLSVFLSVLLLFTACSSGQPAVDTDDFSDTGNKTVVLSGVLSILEYDKISRLSGYDCKVNEFLGDEVLLKLMAGDADVDIYILDADVIRRLREKGLYCTINSEIIKSFNDSCFDHIRELTLTPDGETCAMLIYSGISAMVYPAELEAETGVDMSSLITYENYIDFIKSYRGEREGYISDKDGIFLELTLQYERNFCDFPNKSLDYHTDLFKNIFTSTVMQNDEAGAPTSFYSLKNVGYGGVGNLKLDPNSLLMVDATYLDIMKNSADVSGELRAIPRPKINQECKSNAAATYAIINPYSKNKYGAQKVLETIAEHLDDVQYEFCKYPFMKKDKADYPEKYNPDTKLFEDYYNIAAQAVIPDYWIGVYEYLGFLDKYRSGEITADQAIDEYERMVDIWLNE